MVTETEVLAFSFDCWIAFPLSPLAGMGNVFSAPPPAAPAAKRARCETSPAQDPVASHGGPPPACPPEVWSNALEFLPLAPSTGRFAAVSHAGKEAAKEVFKRSLPFKEVPPQIQVHYTSVNLTARELSRLAGASRRSRPHVEEAARVATLYRYSPAQRAEILDKVYGDHSDDEDYKPSRLPKRYPMLYQLGKLEAWHGISAEEMNELRLRFTGQAEITMQAMTLGLFDNVWLGGEGVQWFGMVIVIKADTPGLFHPVLTIPGEYYTLQDLAHWIDDYALGDRPRDILGIDPCDPDREYADETGERVEFNGASMCIWDTDVTDSDRGELNIPGEVYFRPYHLQGQWNRLEAAMRINAIARIMWDTAGQDHLAEWDMDTGGLVAPDDGDGSGSDDDDDDNQ